MTLIAAGKISDKEGFVVSDIRLTDGNIQSDSALKFTRIKNDEKELLLNLCIVAGCILYDQCSYCSKLFWRFSCKSRS